MFFKRNKNQVGGSAYQHVSAEAPIETQEISSNKTKNIIKQLRNGKEHVNADMAVNVKLDTADAIKSINDLKEALNGITDHPKIHELSSQPLVVYASGQSTKYVWHSSDRETAELLNKPNTRLAIIEDD